jgi:hypothetical protein
MSIRHPAWVFGVPSSLRLSRAAYFGRLRSSGCRRPGGRDPADLSPIKYFLARRGFGRRALRAQEVADAAARRHLPERALVRERSGSASATSSES